MISNGPERMGKMMISPMELMLNFHTKPSDFGWGESSGSCKFSTSPQSAVQMDNRGQEMEWRVLTRWFLQQAPRQPRHSSKPVTIRCGVSRATKFECLDARKFDSWTQEGNKKKHPQFKCANFWFRTYSNLPQNSWVNAPSVQSSNRSPSDVCCLIIPFN